MIVHGACSWLSATNKPKLLDYRALSSHVCSSHNLEGSWVIAATVRRWLPRQGALRQLWVRLLSGCPGRCNDVLYVHLHLGITGVFLAG